MRRVRPWRGGRRRFHALWAALAVFVWCSPALAAQSVVDVDPATGTPRMLARLDGTLTGPSSDTPVEGASSFVASHESELGITSSDLTEEPSTRPLPGGATAVVWRQGVDGVLAVDRSLRVNVAAGGRVLSVMGSPAHDLAASVSPSLSAGEAVRAVQDSVGSYRTLGRSD